MIRLGQRQGFTLIELMVVVAIIAILAAVLIPAVGMVMGKQKVFRTQVVIDSLKVAVEAYMAPSDRFGDAELNGDILDPMALLHHNLDPDDRKLQLSPKICLKHTGTEIGNLETFQDFRYCPVREATHLIDAFGGPILVQVVDEPIPGLEHRTKTVKVMLRSTVGHPPRANLDNQLVDVLHVEKGIWKQEELESITPEGVWILKEE